MITLKEETYKLVFTLLKKKFLHLKLDIERKRDRNGKYC